MIRRISIVAASSCVLLCLSVFAQSPEGAGTNGAKFPWPESSVPTTAPASPQQHEARGSIAIRALQGTGGGPGIGSVPVEVDLRHRGIIVDTIKTQTDAHGVVMLDDLPVAMEIQPVVRVQYANLTYQIEAGLMDAAHPQQQIDVVCYEPTEQPPAWRIQMRHVMVAPVPGGLDVTEVVVLQNPAARTWIGVPIGGPKRVTTAFDLPPGARDVRLGSGFHDWCCSTLSEGRLVNHLPLMPSTSQMVYSYFVPSRSGTAEIDITAPSPVDNMMVLVPEALTMKSCTGLAAGGTQSMGDNSMQAYLASNMKAGDRATIILAGIADSAAEPTSVAASSSTHMVRLIAAIGGGLIILAAAALFLFRGSRPALHPTA